MTLKQLCEVLWGVARQCRAAKVRVVADEVGGSDLSVAEVAAATARDSDLLGQFGAVIEQQHFKTAPSGSSGAKQAGGTASDDKHIKAFHALSLEAGSGQFRRMETPGTTQSEFWL